MEPMSITEVSPEQLKSRLERGDDLLVVDLRQHGVRRIATCIDAETMLFLLAHISTWLPRREGTSPYGA